MKHTRTRRDTIVGLAASAVGLVVIVALSLLAIPAQADTADPPPYGYTADTAAECTPEYPVYEIFEDGSSGCYRTDTPSQTWEPGEFERNVLNDPEYDQAETLEILGVTYDEAVALGWITSSGETPTPAPVESVAPAPDPTPAPTASRPGLPRAGV